MMEQTSPNHVQRNLLSSVLVHGPKEDCSNKFLVAEPLRSQNLCKIFGLISPNHIIYDGSGEGQRKLSHLNHWSKNPEDRDIILYNNRLTDIPSKMTRSRMPAETRMLNLRTRLYLG